MKKKHKGLKILGIVLGGVLLIGYVVRVFTLNQKYPQPQVQTFSMNEWADYDGIEVKVTQAQIKDQDFMVENQLITTAPAPGREAKLLLVTMELKNSSTETAQGRVYLTEAESGAWNNGVAAELVSNVNKPGTSLSAPMKSGESKTVVLPFLINHVQMTDTSWVHAESRSYDLVLGLYPTKKIIPLQITY
jgi:hypothetical protein